jgi:small subunit ribosomal protein S1
MTTEFEQDGGEEYQSTDEGWWNSILAEEQNSPMEAVGENVVLKPPKVNPSVIEDFILDAQKNDEILEVEVFGFNRGGILVQKDSWQGFVPVSHLLDLHNDANETDQRKNLAGYVGKIINVKVIEYVPEEKRIVFSERAAITAKGKRNQLLQSLIPGEIVSGRVTNITNFGVFIDLGGVEGLIHLSELSWGRVQKPETILQIGEAAKVLIMSVNPENTRIALSLKRLTPNPWESLSQNFQPGDVLPAKVTCLTKFGAFACLKEIGVEGLIHISSMGLDEGKSLEDLIQPGDEINVRIIHLDPEKRRLGLCLISPEDHEVES